MHLHNFPQHSTGMFSLQNPPFKAFAFTRRKFQWLLLDQNSLHLLSNSGHQVGGPELRPVRLSLLCDVNPSGYTPDKAVPRLL